MGFRINSGASDSALKKLGEIGEESNDEYECEDLKKMIMKILKAFSKMGKVLKIILMKEKI